MPGALAAVFTPSLQAAPPGNELQGSGPERAPELSRFANGRKPGA